MWVVRAVLGLAARAAVGTLVALALASLYAVFLGGSYGRAFVVALYAVGSTCVLLGAAGGSPARQAAPGALAWRFQAVMPDAVRQMVGRPEDIRLSTGATFVLTGLALVALGLAVG